MQTVTAYQASRREKRAVTLNRPPKERPYAIGHVEGLIADGKLGLVTRQLAREAASSRKVTESDMRLDAIDVALNDFANLLAPVVTRFRKVDNKRVEVTEKVLIQFDGRGTNPVSKLDVLQLVEATWSGLGGAWGRMMTLEGASVQSVAKRIGAKLKEKCGGADEHKRLGYEQSALVLIDYFCEATGWATEETGERMFASVKQETNSLVATPKFLKTVLEEELTDFIEGKPMLVPPVPWLVGKEHGGYLYAQVPAIRGRRKGIEGQAIVDALNALQATAWRANRRVLDVAQVAERAALSVYIEALDAVVEERHSGDVAEYHSTKIRAALTLDTFTELQDEEAFYFPWNLDWRGRMYSATTIVGPQGSDLCKGLLEFAEGTPLGRDGGRWLAITLCNLYGADKRRTATGGKENLKADERVEWTEDHAEMILRVATDPLANRDWQDADKPYQFLAACFEWAGYMVEGEGFRSRLAGGLDGSCSGVQMLAGMTRDESAGEMVNLTPTERGDDYYGRMADALKAGLASLSMNPNERDKAHLPYWKGKTIDRDLLKGPSMTKVYSAGVFTFAEQVAGKAGADESHSLWLARQINACFASVAPGMLAAMDYLQRVADVLTEAGLPLNWTTPAGLVVKQEAFGEITHDLVTKSFGVMRKRDFKTRTKKLSKRAQRAGVSPNFVHGVDAAHMVATVNALAARGVKNFWMVHDSFGAPYAQCQDVFDCTRDTFVTLMSGDLLDVWTKQVTAGLETFPKLVAKLPTLPTYGKLDLEGVRESGFAWF
jgi:DNA-directed RNA polymerase